MRPLPRDDDHVVVIEQQRVGVGAFLLGFGLGAATALLLAPQSGGDTRRGITRRAQDAGDTARRRAQGLVEDVSAGVSGRFDRARDAVELKRHQVQRAVEAGRVAAAQAREDLERRIAATKAAYQAGAAARPATQPHPVDSRPEPDPTPAPRPRVAVGRVTPGEVAPDGGALGRVAPGGYEPHDDGLDG